jgi:hypothetical protein
MTCRHDGSVALSDWLDVAEGSPTPTQRALLDELGEMLDQVQPIALDRGRSRVTWSPGEDDTDHLAANVALQHLRRPDWSIRIHAEPSRAIICWLSAHEHIDATDAWEERSWTTVVVDAVAAVLRGEYEVEEITRLGRWYKTRIIDVSDPGSPEWLRSSGPLWFWLLRPFPARVTHQRLDFTSA